MADNFTKDINGTLRDYKSSNSFAKGFSHRFQHGRR